MGRVLVPGCLPGPDQVVIGRRGVPQASALAGQQWTEGRAGRVDEAAILCGSLAGSVGASGNTQHLLYFADLSLEGG